MGVWWGVEIYGERITPPPEAQIGNPSAAPAPGEAPSGDRDPVERDLPPAN